jgi:Homeodomain-like domain
VWRWQRRYAEAGVEGLLRDKTRRPGKAPLPQTTVAQILALTCTEPPGTATQWTGRAIAKAVGVSLRSVQPIWEAHRLQPHRLRTFKRSTDPAFVVFKSVADTDSFGRYRQSSEFGFAAQAWQMQDQDLAQCRRELLLYHHPPAHPARPRPARLSMAVLHNYATHKHPKVGAWLADHPRSRIHSLPQKSRTSSVSTWIRRPTPL